ncbi:hypothetical protein [Candidatus Liberibacter africanus]|uniref:hypothetical protein n=1 Tax=Liberibacter africanus TaxID=34020 RepID=UPI0006414B5B|nr:hypothetical protein [Candidatus Liberibacter africanus]
MKVHVPIFESLQTCLDVVGKKHDTFQQLPVVNLSHLQLLSATGLEIDVKEQDYPMNIEP